MLVGLPKEIKDNEYRVGIAPSTVRELTDHGHRVVLESRAGAGAGFGTAIIKLQALCRIAARLCARVRTLFSTSDVVELLCRRADLVIAAVLAPGGTAPKLISARTIKAMKPGSVIVDVAIDQGGCTETSRPTTHLQPTYIVDEEVVHYCVTNMLGAVPRTSTIALTSATTAFILALAEKGWRSPSIDDPNLRNGLNVHRSGYVSCRCRRTQPALHARRPVKRFATRTPWTGVRRS